MKNLYLTLQALSLLVITRENGVGGDNRYLFRKSRYKIKKIIFDKATDLRMMNDNSSQLKKKIEKCFAKLKKNIPLLMND